MASEDLAAPPAAEAPPPAPAPRPPRAETMRLAFGLGLASTILAALLTLPIVPFVTGPRSGSGAAAFVLAAVVAGPLVEELCKGFALPALARADRPALTPEGWLTAGALVGAGFSVLETLFFGMAFGAVDPLLGGYVVVQRLLLTVPAHAIPSALVGYGFGLRAAGRGWGPLVAGFAAAVLLHGAVNGWTLVLGGGV